MKIKEYIKPAITVVTLNGSAIATPLVISSGSSTTEYRGIEEERHGKWGDLWKGEEDNADGGTAKDSGW